MEIGHVVEVAVADVREVPEHVRRPERLVAEPGRDVAREVERHLHAQQLLQLVLGRDGLLLLPAGFDRLSRLAHGLERRVDVRRERGARVSAARDHVGVGTADLDRVLRRDDRAERVAQQGEALQPERLSKQVDVAGEDVERQRRGIDPLAAPLPALVHVEQPELVAERVEVGPKRAVVEPRPAVQHDHREAVADLLDVQRDAVRELDVQLFASLQSSPVPTSTASGGSRS